MIRFAPIRAMRVRGFADKVVGAVKATPGFIANVKKQLTEKGPVLMSRPRGVGRGQAGLRGEDEGARRDARLAHYRVVVTDSRWLAHLAVGMRWTTWGSQALEQED